MRSILARIAAIFLKRKLKEKEKKKSVGHFIRGFFCQGLVVIKITFYPIGGGDHCGVTVNGN